MAWVAVVYLGGVALRRPETRINEIQPSRFFLLLTAERRRGSKAKSLTQRTDLTQCRCMKNMKRMSVPLLTASLLLYASCSNETDLAAPSGGSRQLTVIATQGLNARTAYDTGDASALIVTWADQDAFSVFTASSGSGNPADFTLTSGGGTKTGIFTGTVSVAEGTTLYAVYPKQTGTLDPTAISFDFTGQTQAKNNDASHLAAYDVMAAKAVVPHAGLADGKALSLNFTHLATALKVTVKLPANAGNATKLTVYSQDNCFYTAGTANIAANIPVLTGCKEKMGRSFSIQLGKEGTGIAPDADGTVTAYLMMPATSLSRILWTDLKATKYSSSGTGIFEIEETTTPRYLNVAVNTTANGSAGYYIGTMSLAATGADSSAKEYTAGNCFKVAYTADLQEPKYGDCSPVTITISNKKYLVVQTTAEDKTCTWNEAWDMQKDGWVMPRTWVYDYTEVPNGNKGGYTQEWHYSDNRTQGYNKVEITYEELLDIKGSTDWGKEMWKGEIEFNVGDPDYTNYQSFITAFASEEDFVPGAYWSASTCPHTKSTNYLVNANYLQVGGYFGNAAHWNFMGEKIKDEASTVWYPYKVRLVMDKF